MLLVMAGRRTATGRRRSKEESKGGGSFFLIRGFSPLPPSLGLYCLLREAVRGTFPHRDA